MREALAAYDSEVTIHSEPEPGNQNILEWALPAIIAILALGPVKAFSDGFFEAAGAGAYNRLKEALVTAYRKGGETKRAIAPSSRPDDLRYHPPLLIEQPIEGGTVRFVFPAGLGDADVQHAFAEMNSSLSEMRRIIGWQLKQIQLREQYGEQLFGETYDVVDRIVYMQEALNTFVFGAWVYIGAEKAWAKTF